MSKAEKSPPRFDERAFRLEQARRRKMARSAHRYVRGATKAAAYLATVVGFAHARQMDSSTRISWQRELSRHRTKDLDAPLWLWTAVVELLVDHERSYLEHCRRYALAEHDS
jgi:uncharacterized protein (DUF2252 family)